MTLAHTLFTLRCVIIIEQLIGSFRTGGSQRCALLCKLRCSLLPGFHLRSRGDLTAYATDIYTHMLPPMVGSITIYPILATLCPVIIIAIHAACQAAGAGVEAAASHCGTRDIRSLLGNLRGIGIGA